MIMAEEDDAAADEVDDPTEDDVTCLEEDGPIDSVFGGLLGGTRPAAALLLLLPLLFFAEPLFFDDREFELPNDATELLDDIRIMPGIFLYYYCGLGCLCALAGAFGTYAQSAICYQVRSICFESSQEEIVLRHDLSVNVIAMQFRRIRR